MSLTFVKGMKLGEEVEIEAKVIRIGGRLAQTTAEFRNLKGETLAFGSHTKCNIDPRNKL